MLEIKNLCYQVTGDEGELDILQDISLTVADHKFVVITGPNGGGKTTLAKKLDQAWAKKQGGGTTA